MSLVRITHPDVAEDALVPESAVSHHAKSGWRRVDEGKQAEAKPAKRKPGPQGGKQNEGEPGDGQPGQEGETR